MTANLCVRCGRPTPDGYACSSCANRAGGQLHDIADMAGAARDVAHGFARRGVNGGGSDPRLPLNLAATQRLDAVQANLTGWIEHIARERGVTRPWFDPTNTGSSDPIVIAADFLAGHTEWIRHRAPDAEGHWGAEDFLTDVEACARVVAGIARGPASQRYLGPCGTPTGYWIDSGGGTYPQYIDGPDCPGDIYAREGAQHGACRTCGATVGVDDRRAWLDAEVRSHAFRAVEIAQAYGVNVNTIRSWASRGQLVPHGNDSDGRPLFNVGDVLDLAAADAARRATEQAKRARRVEARRAG